MAGPQAKVSLGVCGERRSSRNDTVGAPTGIVRRNRGQQFAGVDFFPLWRTGGRADWEADPRLHSRAIALGFTNVRMDRRSANGKRIQNPPHNGGASGLSRPARACAIQPMLFRFLVVVAAVLVARLGQTRGRMERKADIHSIRAPVFAGSYLPTLS